MTTTVTQPLTPQALHELIEAGEALVLDVRGPAEHAAGAVPGALNVPLAHLDALREDLRAASARRPLVLVCASGVRSAAARDSLRDAGITARDLPGGTAAWEAAGLPLAAGPAPAGRAPWAMDRQVRFTAGALVLTGLALGLRAPRARLLAAGVAGGLVWSAVSDTCAMARVLGRLPFNRPAPDTLHSARAALRD
ncbi:rhodanese-like domain-containing protein [Streptomyces sp. BI20]|uniref:rhodanese-like domain-containing protein n=1 Tax=Streptomyces sp. BI20 TaxID=3403460 RepID=UPI003C75A79F